MGDLLEFARRPTPDGPSQHGAWSFDIRVFAPAADGDYASAIVLEWDEVGESDGDRLRAQAENLEQIALLMRDRAEEIAPSEDGPVVAALTVWQSSRVHSRVSQHIETPEQIAWLARRYDDAKAVI